MTQFLQEYSLYLDLVRLNNQEYFQEHFQTSDLTDFFSKIDNELQYKFHQKSIDMFNLNLRKSRAKSLYVILKWMICIHEIIAIGSFRVNQTLAESLAQIQSPQLKKPYERYMYSGIVKPYIQFLFKLINIKNEQKCEKIIKDKENLSLSTQEEVIWEQEMNKENGDFKCLSKSLFYAKYNLIKYTIKELVPFAEQLKYFFKENYPLLTRLNKMVKTDLQRLIKDLSPINKSSIDGICRYQLQGYSKELLRLQLNEEENEESWQINEEMSIKMSNFMQSAIKPKEDGLEQQQQSDVKFDVGYFNIQN